MAKRSSRTTEELPMDEVAEQDSLHAENFDNGTTPEAVLSDSPGSGSFGDIYHKEEEPGVVLSSIPASPVSPAHPSSPLADSVRKKQVSIPEDLHRRLCMAAMHQMTTPFALAERILDGALPHFEIVVKK